MNNNMNQMTTNQLEQIGATADIIKSRASDFEKLSGFMYSGAFTTCFMYNLRGKLTGLNTEDAFIKDRPRPLFQLLLKELIRELNFDFKGANITDKETLSRLQKF